IKDVSGIKREYVDLAARHHDLLREIDTTRALIEALPSPIWARHANGRLAFVNAAYAIAVEAKDAADAIARNIDLLDRNGREGLDQQPTDSAVLDRLRATRKLPEQADFRSWKAQLHAAYRALESHEHQWHLPDGRTLRVITTPSPEGGVTYLFDDVTERLDLERRFDALIRVQRETLDNLSEGVAVFGSDGRLRLHNPVFAGMWRLAPPA